MEVGLFKSELLAESTTKLGISSVIGCDFAAVSSFIVSNKVLIRFSFFFVSLVFHFFLDWFLYDRDLHHERVKKIRSVLILS